MLRRVTISWFKQRSGSYALKGITVEEGERAYDSSVNFREQDAEWVTRTLQAQADVELSGKKEFSQNSEGYPEWALSRGLVTEVEVVSPIERERANASVLRHLLREIMKVVGSDTEDDRVQLQKLINQANGVLQSTASPTDYSLEEALSILTMRDTKPLTGLGSAANRKSLKPR
jgi:hypothetical protein